MRLAGNLARTGVIRGEKLGPIRPWKSRCRATVCSNYFSWALLLPFETQFFQKFIQIVSYA